MDGTHGTNRTESPGPNAPTFFLPVHRFGKRRWTGRLGRIDRGIAIQGAKAWAEGDGAEYMTGITRETWGGKEAENTHLEGAIGEVAAARFYGLEPSLSDVSDGGTDLRLGSYSCDVKTAQWWVREKPFLKMWVRGESAGKADAYLLVCADPFSFRFEIVGWCLADTVKASPTEKWANNPRAAYAVPHTVLNECNRREVA